MITALHEAGHAVIAVRLGIGVDSVEMFDSEYRRDFEDGTEAVTRYLPNDLTDTRILENRIVIAIAACEINRLFGIDALEMDYQDFLKQAGSNDIMMAMLFVYLLGLSPENRKAAADKPIPVGSVNALDDFTKAFRRLDSLLDKTTLEAIVRVATRLSKQSRMTGDEVQEEL